MMRATALTSSLGRRRGRRAPMNTRPFGGGTQTGVSGIRGMFGIPAGNTSCKKIAAAARLPQMQNGIFTAL